MVKSLFLTPPQMTKLNLKQVMKGFQGWENLNVEVRRDTQSSACFWLAFWGDNDHQFYMTQLTDELKMPLNKRTAIKVIKRFIKHFKNETTHPMP